VAHGIADLCKSPTLVKVDFLLFLNKCDLLEKKLKRGLKLKKFIPQYNGDNTLPDAIQCAFHRIFSFSSLAYAVSSL
jgi:hypothetical protein